MIIVRIPHAKEKTLVPRVPHDMYDGINNDAAVPGPGRFRKVKIPVHFK